MQIITKIEFNSPLKKYSNLSGSILSILENTVLRAPTAIVDIIASIISNRV